MLANLLPGLRELRAPLAAGYVWLLAGWIALEPHIDSGDSRIFESLSSLGDVASAIGLGVAVSFAAYLVGLLSVSSLNPLLRRLRPGLSPKSRRAAENHVVSTLQRIDARVAGTSTSLRRLVLDETPGESDSGITLVPRVSAAVAGEVELIRTRLLDKKPDLFHEADRPRAEAEFRLGVTPALLGLAAAVVYSGGVLALPAAVVLVVAAGGLLLHGRAADRAASDVIVLVLTDGLVDSPTLERLETAAKRAEPGDDDPPRQRPEQVVDAARDSLRSAVGAIRDAGADPASPTFAMIPEQARDQIARIPVYLRRSSDLTKAVEEADTLLEEIEYSLRQNPPVPEEKLKQLEQRTRSIERLATAELADPGLYDELKANLDRVRDKIETGSPQEKGLAVLAIEAFFSADRPEYHRRAISVLAEAARSPDLDVRLTAKELFERAAGDELLASKLTDESWAGADLSGLQLAGVSLFGIDLRDANLVNSDLTGATLHRAQLHNTRLNGANLTGAELLFAVLEYTDLAEASLEGAKLGGATLKSPLVAGLRLAGAELDQTTLDPLEIPWHRTLGWRDAHLSPEHLEVATELAGAPPSGTRVLMPMWEVPPLVAGGSWTACYHLVRRLRARGADVTVVVPWSSQLCDEDPFATEIDVVHLGIEPFGLSPVGAYAAHELEVSPYSPYHLQTAIGAIGAYGGYGAGPYGAAPELVPVVEEFARRLEEFSRREEFDVIHAQDWVTFPAAELAAGNRPWIAHFHSTAAERHANGTDPVGTTWEREIERRAALGADAVLAPSKGTASVIYREYAPEEVRVAPNPLSRDGPAQELGDVEGNRVVFTGRMTAQKGIDHFVEIAQAADDLLGETGWEFVAFGEGFERERAAEAAGDLVRFEGGLPWAARLNAFVGARAVVVPSRAEPFGMVVLEAMEVGVPVLYPSASGVAEVIRAGKQIEPADPRSVVQALTDLLTRETEWYATAAFQLDEIERYRAAAHEDVVRQAWADALERRASRGALPESASDRAAAARTPR